MSDHTENAAKDPKAKQQAQLIESDAVEDLYGFTNLSDQHVRLLADCNMLGPDNKQTLKDVQTDLNQLDQTWDKQAAKSQKQLVKEGGPEVPHVVLPGLDIKVSQHDESGKLSTDFAIKNLNPDGNLVSVSVNGATGKVRESLKERH